MNTELAKSEPESYMSLIVDGADYTKFSLPDFMSHTKDTCGGALTVHIIGVLFHAIGSQLRILTMTEDHTTGANHFIEAISRVMNSEAK